MAQNLKNLGEQLKQKRAELNLSLREAENATSIRIAHLTAIEEGDMKKLISPVYAQGFVKQYASFLGLDGEKLVREHVEIFNAPFNNASPENFYGIGSVEMRGNPASGVKWLPNLAWAIAFLAVIGLAWYCAKIFEVL